MCLTENAGSQFYQHPTEEIESEVIEAEELTDKITQLRAEMGSEFKDRGMDQEGGR